MNNSVLTAAKLHFQPMRNELVEIYIPEWSNEECQKFFATALNIKERQEVEKRTKDDLELAVEIIILKLKNQHDKAVFSRADKPQLLRSVCPQVIGRVAREILEIGMISIEDIEKN